MDIQLFIHATIIIFSVPLRRVSVPDSRYDWLCEHWKPPSTIPAYLQVVDIAGLVKGAHEGQVSLFCCCFCFQWG